MHAHLQPVTETDFAARVLESERPVVVDIWAAWCPPCRVMTPVLDELAAERPEIAFVTLDADANQRVVVEQLAAGTADVALLAVHDAGPKLPTTVAVHTIAEEPLWLLAAPDHQLADPGNPSPAIDDLRGHPVILPERGTALRELLDTAFAEAGFSPLPFFETSDPSTIRRLAGAGLGVAIVPAGWLGDDGPPVAILRPQLPLPAYRVAVLATTTPRIPTRDLLVDHLTSALTARRRGE